MIALLLAAAPLAQAKPDATGRCISKRLSAEIKS